VGQQQPTVMTVTIVIHPTVRSRSARAGQELSEGLPVPREPAYVAKRSQDGEARAASE
jgi:uncharacterized protein YbbK (DUF523 family)